jgi:mannosylglycerate hydrolase MGH1-like protein
VPRDLTDFSLFGYLRNPAHQARGWGDTSGGNLRAMTDRLGVEWAYPVGRDATAHAGIALETGNCRSRADFDAIGTVCHHHTSLMLGYHWRTDGLTAEAHFFLVNDEALAVRATLRNATLEQRHADLRVVFDQHGQLPEPHVLAGHTTLDAHLAPGEERRLVAVLVRGSAEEPPIAQVDAAYRGARREDRAFLEHCPTLSGDWPAHWAEGLHHDFQTTRLLVQPAGGIFADVWPAWMAAWPRVVFAEGTLDMLRLAYADPDVAKRAVATLLRDAPAANIPCVFRGGEPNMVAADGSRCGTSPAWCLPFLNLQLLYLGTLDRAWLAEIYPYAAAYLDWWLAHRTDADGWLVYKCTWESGEDGNPRLDPTGSGDADISQHARPVELQATLAHAAGVLAFFATELGADPSRWHSVSAEYRRRTQSLFDPVERRYRDRLTAPRDTDQTYWGIDPHRYSAQSLTPLLVGLPLDPVEVERHMLPPWSLWPSWTWSVVESAAAAGMSARVGELAYETIDRVYHITTRRELGSLRRPMPGCSPEFWPEDWRTYGGSDAYGWGATTANLLIRHLFGFKESLDTTRPVLELVPAFPRQMLRLRAEYGIDQLNYRGKAFDVRYTVLDPDGRLRVSVDLPDAHRELEARNGERLTLHL